MGTGVLSKGKRIWDVNLTRHFSVQLMLRMCGYISLLLAYSSMVWTGINVVVAVVVVVLHVP